MSAIETILQSVKDKQLVRYKKQSIDLFTASAIAAVYNAVSEPNKKILAELCERDILKAQSICFKLCK